MSRIRIISVDFQRDFISLSGKYFIPGPSVDFVKP